MRKIQILADSRLSDLYMKRLYIMDSTTIILFKGFLKGVDRNAQGRLEKRWHKGSHNNKSR